MKFISKFTTALLLLALMLSIMPLTTHSAQAAPCYLAQFRADVTIPDGMNFAPGTAFTKVWKLRNIGSCAWNASDVSLIFKSGEQMGAPASTPLPHNVDPGKDVEITVPMTAPSAPRNYVGYYKFKSAQGGEFGILYTTNNTFWVEINVTGSVGAGYDFVAGAADANTKWSSGALTSFTFPGTDGSTNGFALKRDKPRLENGVELAQAGLLFVPNNVSNGYVQAVYPEFKVQTGDRFQATIGCESGATSCYVAYRLDYQIGANAVKTFWTFREKNEGLSYNVDLNLNSLAGQNVKFILVISAYGSPVGDRALWVNPIISRAGVIGPTITPSPTVTGTPPSPTPSRTPTPGPAACDRAQFVKDVTYADGAIVQPNAPFSKTWRIRNVGTCTWTNYSLMFDSGEKMGGPDSAIIPTTVLPGKEVDITVVLTAPSAPNTYRGNWKLKNNNGIPFGIGSAGTKSFWVEIKVAGTPVTPSTPPTPITPGTPVTPATPIVGTSYDFVANVCAAKWYSGAGELPCPGTEGDAKGFVLISGTSKLENGTIDNRSGLLTYPQNITNGYIQGIYPTYKVKSGDKFRAIVNCEGGATNCYVVFRLEYSVAGSSSVQTFWAFVERYEGQFYTANIDLAPLVGQDLKFVLTVLATGSPAGDRALWVAPIIYNAGLVAPVPPTNTPTPTATATPVTPIAPAPTNTPTATPVTPIP